MVTELKDGANTYYAKTRAAWRAWLQKNHQTQKSVWLIMYKKGSGIPSIYYPEAVEEALCFGWIDSKPNKRDENSHYQYFTKRNPKSNWSKLNKSRVEKLLSAGLIMPAGMEMIELAKQTGTWNALGVVDALSVPDDLQMAFDKNEIALTNWNAFSRSARWMILAWILSAKRTETRSKRIEETVRLAAENKRANFPD